MRSFLRGKIFFLIVISALYSNQNNYKDVDSILVGRYQPEKVGLFLVVPKEYSQQTIFVHREALESFLELAKAAKKEGFDIYIISGVRNFFAQKSIWEAKFNGGRLVEGLNLKDAIPDETERSLKILEFSSMPGTSRHHWGTDIDIGFDPKNPGRMLTNEAYQKGTGKRFYEWMEKNASRYGYCQPYKDNPSDRGNDTSLGYQEEKWHWSYKPVAKSYLEMYIKNAKKFKPEGFEGAASGGEFYLDFVKNIHKDCR